MKETDGQITAIDLTEQALTELLATHDATTDSPFTTITAEHVSKNDELVNIRFDALEKNLKKNSPGAGQTPSSQFKGGKGRNEKKPPPPPTWETSSRQTKKKKNSDEAPSSSPLSAKQKKADQSAKENSAKQKRENAARAKATRKSPKKKGTKAKHGCPRVRAGHGQPR